MTQNTPKRKPARRPVQQSSARRPVSRAAYIRAQRKKQRMQMLFLAGLAVLLIAIIVIIILATGSGKEDAARQAVAQPAETVSAEATIEPTATPTPAPTPTPRPGEHGENPVYAALRPTAHPGCLPVFRSIDTTDKVVAITVDDCYQADNFRKIVDLALEYNAKLTIFPIGENAIRDSQAETLRYAWENGMEIENHTYTHNGLYDCSDEELAKEIYMQNLALSHVLGVEYQCHFLRPKGGDARHDQRIHEYIDQLGYYGIAHWSDSGNASAKKLVTNLAPGQIYLFHTTDKDLKTLQGFIPYLVSQGYRMITMNEMFGYASNEYKDLTIPIEEHTVPPLEAFEYVDRIYEEGNFAYRIKEIQNRLSELGFLTEKGGGYYGEITVKAVKDFQKAAGLQATGTSDLETQNRLFAADAPRK